MKKLLIGACVLAASLVAAFVVFVAGLELGHRWGYDKEWRDCKTNAKEPCTRGVAILSTNLSGNGMVARIPGYTVEASLSNKPLRVGFSRFSRLMLLIPADRS